MKPAETRKPELLLKRRVRTMLLMVVGVCLVFPSLRAFSQAPQDTKDAAKKAIGAFFNRKPGSTETSTLLGNLSDQRLVESSGLAASRRNPNVFWTHNDSGDGPYLFAIDRKGQTLTRFSVSGARNVDWEDIAVGPGANGKPAIYIGDIGDNNRNRDNTVVYRVQEPAVETGKWQQEKALAGAEAFPYNYPDGHHDAETLMVHPLTRQVFIVTKEKSGISGIYMFPMPMTPGVKVTLNKLGTVLFESHFLTGKLSAAERLATGGDIAPDGKQFVIRTYISAYQWNLAPNQSIGEAVRVPPRVMTLPLSRQGEAICYRADGKALLTTSESKNAPLYEIILR